MTVAPVAPHGGNEKAQIPGRHIGQGVGPVFEHALVDALGLMQMPAPVGRDARPQDMVVAPLDDVDGVDLHIAEMFDRRAGGRGAIAERRRRGELLGVQPDALGVRPGQGMGFG